MRVSVTGKVEQLLLVATGEDCRVGGAQCVLVILDQEQLKQFVL